MFAQDEPRIPSRYQFKRNPTANPKSVVSGQGKGGSYRFTLLTPRLLRYEWSDDGGFEDRASTFALFRSFLPPKYSVKDGPSGLEIKTPFFTLRYDKKRFSQDGLSVAVSKDVWRYDGKSYGDLGGTARTLDGADGRIELAPGVVSRKKAYAVLDDSNSMLFETDGWIAARRPGRIDGYLFAHSGDYKGAIAEFYQVSGPQPVLPRWTLGNWWSRYHAYSQSEYLDVMHKFKCFGIPLTVGVIDMDWHKVDIPPEYGSGWTGYSWNRELFPDPDRFLAQLHELGLRVTLNDHPADGIRAFEDQYKQVARYLNHDTSKGEPIPFDCTDRSFLDAYFDVLKANLEKQGVDFWWIDWQQGNKSKLPGIDPLWVLNHYHYFTSRRNVPTNEKPITFSRYAGPGSHRYPIGFSGDTVITWRSLQFQPEFTATASNIGFGWWSHDIGGHFAGIRSNDLTARWVQFGCFSPILRLHSEKSQWNSKEPWKYELETAAIMRKYLVFRHRLIPYLYTMNLRASYFSQPLIQPMYWNHKEDAAYTVPNQYYFGSSMIAVPITQPLSRISLLGCAPAWLPKGRYIDIIKPTLVYDGGRRYRLHRRLQDIPVLAKQGSIFVLDQRTTFCNGADRPDALEINLVVGDDAEYCHAEETDDESYRAYLQPDCETFAKTFIKWDQKKGHLEIQESSKGPGRGREWTVKLLGVTGDVHPSAEIGVNRCVKFTHHSNTDGGYTVVNLGRIGNWSTTPDSKIVVSLGKNLQLDVLNIPDRLHDVLYRAEMSYPMKEVIWRLTTQDRSDTSERVERLLSMNIDASIKDAVMEIWAADGRAEGSAKGLEKWSADDTVVSEAETIASGGESTPVSCDEASPWSNSLLPKMSPKTELKRSQGVRFDDDGVHVTSQAEPDVKSDPLGPKHVSEPSAAQISKLVEDIWAKADIKLETGRKAKLQSNGVWEAGSSCDVPQNGVPTNGVTTNGVPTSGVVSNGATTDVATSGRVADGNAVVTNSEAHVIRSNVVIRGVMESSSTGANENNVRIERLNVVVRGTMEISAADGENTSAQNGASTSSAEEDAGYVLVSRDA